MATVRAAEARALNDVVTRLRRTLRRAIRSEYPWEARPMAQIEVLQTVQEAGRARVGDIAEQLRLAQSTVSALIGRLADEGLLERTTDALDRRASLVGLTPAGRADLRAWDAAHRRRLGRALRALSPDDRERVLAALPALGRLVEALDADTSAHG